jgi:N-acetylmuramoyl-L-alanine amidase
MTKNKIISGIILILLITFLYNSKNYISQYVKQINNYSSAFFSIGTSISDLLHKYSDTTKNEKIKILLIPGHEPDFGGTEYKNLIERDLNLILSEKIKIILEKNNRFEIISTRYSNGWNTELQKYINDNNNSIQSWIKTMKDEMIKLINNGDVVKVNAKMGHATIPNNSAIFLYGINKWAGEKKVDIAINIHFNDNPKYKGKPNYEGFVIYVPEKQYSNSSSSKLLAKDLFNEISKIQKPSTMPNENGGIVEDQELIALGRYNTSDSLSVIIEYAYIYETLMQNTTTRNNFLDKAASSTARAVNIFFESRM